MIQISKRMEKIKPSPTLAVSAQAKTMKAEGIDVIGFGAGEPDFDTPDNIKNAAVKAIAEGFTKYTPAGGIIELKAAICKKFKTDNNLDYDPANIIVSCGAKHSLYNICQAILYEGDEVIIPAPYWVSYPDMVYLAGATPVFIEADEKNAFKITPEELTAKITPKTKAVILNSPSNPTGTAYTRDELKAIARVVIDSGITIISDEIYEKIVYGGFECLSIADVEPEIRNQTIIVNGVSKSYSMTGWRIGYTAGPKEVISAMANIQSQSTSNPTSIAQKASLEALTGPQDCIGNMLQEFEKRMKYMVGRLNSIPGFSCFTPSGAFYTFPNISGIYGKKSGNFEITDSASFAKYLLESSHVAVVAGSGFGADNNIRLSYATSFENIEKGLDRIEKAVNELKE